jgi:hypothetical protein
MAPRKALATLLLQLLAAGSCAVDQPTVLNEDLGPRLSSVSDDALPARLRVMSNQLVALFVDGRRVDYDGLAASELFAEYRALVGQLPRFPLEALETQAQRLAFWTNLYNALVMHAVLASGVQSSVREQNAFFDRYAYRIGGYTFTPNDIEHGILRRARFRPEDPRLRFAVQRLDARIHFALNCASAGCPPIAAYDEEHIDDQFDLATRAFVNSTSGARLDTDAHTIYLSRIFEWYRDDFGEEEDAVLRFLLTYLRDGEARDYLARHVKTIIVRYDDYDWSLNH